MIIILIIMKIDYHHHCHDGSGKTTAAGRKQRSTTDCGSRATKSNKYDIFKIVMIIEHYHYDKNHQYVTECWTPGSKNLIFDLKRWAPEPDCPFFSGASKFTKTSKVY